MANKPVIGYKVCPYCSGKVPVIWDGNRKQICMYCKKPFRVKRQKLKNTMRVERPLDGAGRESVEGMEALYDNCT